MPRIHYHGSDYSAREGETVLDALLRQGASLAFSCRAGSCHQCALRILEGTVPDRAMRGLPANLRERGYFLPCRCVPEQDIAIANREPADFTIKATVTSKQIASPGVCILKLEPHETVQPVPGQYVMLQHADGSPRPYSVASLPEEDGFLELHIARRDEGHVSRWIHDDVTVGATVHVQRPEGSFGYAGTDQDQPLLMLCTGTGIAPVIAVLRDALRHDHRGAIYLFHGVRNRAELYLDAQLQALSRLHDNLHYVACCSREKQADGCDAGRVTKAAAQRFSCLDGYRVFLAGNPSMVAEASLWAESMCVAQSNIIVDPFTAHRPDAVPKQNVRLVPPPDAGLWAALDEGRILHEVLVEFYGLAFADERLGPYFRGVTKQRLVEKQYSFLRNLICGQRDYFGQRPRNAHHWMVISEELFDYRLDLMAACLVRHGVGEPWLSAWHAYENAFRSDIVKREPWPRMVGGQPVLKEGLEEAVLDAGTLCDVCGAEIASGVSVRFHTRLGTTYCPECSRRGDGAANA